MLTHWTKTVNTIDLMLALPICLSSPVVPNWHGCSLSLVLSNIPIDFTEKMPYHYTVYTVIAIYTYTYRDRDLVFTPSCEWKLSVTSASFSSCSFWLLPASWSGFSSDDAWIIHHCRGVAVADLYFYLGFTRRLSQLHCNTRQPVMYINSTRSHMDIHFVMEVEIC